MVLTNQLIYLVCKHQNHEEDFFQIMCASQKVRTLCTRMLQFHQTFDNLNLRIIHIFLGLRQKMQVYLQNATLPWVQYLQAVLQTLSLLHCEIRQLGT